MRAHATPRNSGPTRSPIGSGDGRIEFSAVPAGAAYFVAEGVRWRIYDCIVRRGHFERVYLESDAATYRVFVSPDGRQLSYHRSRREEFTLSPNACERQLKEARELVLGMRLDLR